MAAGEKCSCVNKTLNPDGTTNMYSGISTCTKEDHVHVKCDPVFISQVAGTIGHDHI